MKVKEINEGNNEKFKRGVGEIKRTGRRSGGMEKKGLSVKGIEWRDRIKRPPKGSSDVVICYLLGGLVYCLLD